MTSRMMASLIAIRKEDKKVRDRPLKPGLRRDEVRELQGHLNNYAIPLSDDNENLRYIKHVLETMKLGKISPTGLNLFLDKKYEYTITVYDYVV